MEQIENTATFMEKFQLLLGQGEALPLPVQGSSMTPFLVHRRDAVLIEKPSRPLKVGDIVLYQRANGAYILHRICAVCNGSYTLIGDAHTIREPGIGKEQIFGVVVEARRKGAVQRPGTFWWECFARIWVRIIPLRPAVLRIYSVLTNRFKRGRSL